MREELKNRILIALLALFCGGGFLAFWLMPDAAFSQSERRPLAQRPALSVPALLSGDFMAGSEDYVQDQFPLREGFRRLKALAARYVFAQRVVNGLYLEGGHLAALDKELRAPMISHAAERFGYVYEQYLADTGSEVFLAVVPDKHAFLAEGGGYPAPDYAQLVQSLCAQTDFAQYVDIWSGLSVDDYYRTDNHWRQERLLPTAQTLAAALGVTLGADYEIKSSPTPFYGVYAGQSALPIAADTLSWLENDMLAQCVVTSYDGGAAEKIPLYDPAAAQGRDPYEMFVGGADALVTIENPAAAVGGRELIVFRDSFGSSLAPLLAEAYAKITLVDLRYVRSDYLGTLVDFHGQDVLFLYSTGLLNNSLALQ